MELETGEGSTGGRGGCFTTLIVPTKTRMTWKFLLLLVLALLLETAASAGRCVACENTCVWICVVITTIFVCRFSAGDVWVSVKDSEC